MIPVRDILGSKIHNDLIEVAYGDMFKRVHSQVSNQVSINLTRQIGNQVWNEVKSNLYFHIKQNKKL